MITTGTAGVRDEAAEGIVVGGAEAEVVVGMVSGIAGTASTTIITTSAEVRQAEGRVDSITTIIKDTTHEARVRVRTV
jgi:hypothetical protein